MKLSKILSAAAFASLALISLVSAQAEEGNYNATSPGRYAGQSRDGKECGLQIIDVQKSLLLSKVKKMDVQVIYGHGTLAGNILKCKSHIEEGFSCSSQSAFGHIVLKPLAVRETYTDENGDPATQIKKPYFFMTGDSEYEFTCSELTRVD